MTNSKILDEVDHDFDNLKNFITIKDHIVQYPINLSDVFNGFKGIYFEDRVQNPLVKIKFGTVADLLDNLTMGPDQMKMLEKLQIVG